MGKDDEKADTTGGRQTKQKDVGEADGREADSRETDTTGVRQTGGGKWRTRENEADETDQDKQAGERRKAELRLT